MSYSDIYDLSIQAINEKKARSQRVVVLEELRAAREVVEAARGALRTLASGEGMPPMLVDTFSTRAAVAERFLREALAAYDALKEAK